MTSSPLAPGMEPFTKMIYEQLSGRSTFPDFTRPSVIRDRKEHLARLAALDGVYRKVVGRPHRDGNLLDKIGITYTTDPGEAAYFDVRQRAAKWLDENGEPSRGMSNPTERDNALYYWKRAVQWGDTTAAKKYKAKYRELGGTPGGMRSSIKRGAPLGSLNGPQRRAFLGTLSREDRELLIMANKWHARLYGGK